MARRVRLNKDALFKALGYEPHPGQLAIHNSRAPRRVVACGVRFGKSLCAAMEALAAAMEPRERSLGWIVAPTYDLSERVFNQAVTIAVSHLKHRIVRVSEHDRRIVLRNLGGGLSEIRGKSADNPISLLGEGLDFLIVDEASRLRPSIWEGHLSQRLIDRKGWALLISTPKGKGWYFDLWKRGQGADPAFESWNLPSWTNPLLAREERAWNLEHPEPQHIRRTVDPALEPPHPCEAAFTGRVPPWSGLSRHGCGQVRAKHNPSNRIQASRLPSFATRALMRALPVHGARATNRRMTNGKEEGTVAPLERARADRLHAP